MLNLIENLNIAIKLIDNLKYKVIHEIDDVEQYKADIEELQNHISYLKEIMERENI